MASKKTSGAELSLEDIRAWADQMRVEYGIEAVLLMRMLGKDFRTTAFEVRLYDILDGPPSGGRAPLVSQRMSVTTKAATIWPTVMLAFTQAWSIYLDNPWGWTARHRASVRLLEGSPGGEE